MHAAWMKYAWQIGFGEHRTGRSSEPKLIEIPFIMTVVQQWNRVRGTDTEGGTERFLTQAGEALHHLLESVTEALGNLQVSKSDPKNTRWAFCRFIYKCLPLSFFTRKLANVYSRPSTSENTKQVLPDGFKYTCERLLILPITYPCYK